MSAREATARRGRFITLEGGEGTGKSTQAARLAQALRERNITVVETREPGGTEGAEIVRRTVLSGRVKPFGAVAEALLMNAARDDHLAEVVRPALAAGQWVVSDRFADSTRAYQGALGGVDDGLVATLEAAVVGETWPDLTLVLDIDPGIGLARAREASGAGSDRFEDADLAWHGQLRGAFLDIAAAEPERCVLIDASGAPDEVAAAIWRAVAARLAVADADDAEASP